MRTYGLALLALGCSGDPFVSIAVTVDDPPTDAAVTHQGDAASTPCNEGPLCAPCSGENFHAPAAGECQELAVHVDQRFLQCMVGRCSFQCETHPEIAPGLCPSFPGQCAFPVPEAQALFCTP